MEVLARMVGDPKTGYVVNQCKKMGLWEPLEKREAVLSVTINGRRIYFKNNAQYKVFRAACNKFKEAGMDLNDFLDSLPNVIKIKEDKDMNKKLVKLTEGDLRNIVKRSVNRILREFGSDGPDFDEPYGTSDMFQNIGMLSGEHANSANDIDDFNPDTMSIYGDDDSSDEDFDIDNSEFDPIDLPESRRRRGKVIKESDDDFNYDAYYRSLKGFLNNPIDINNGDYNPSDEEIMSAMGDLNLDDLDLDLDLPESKKRMGRIIRESINKVLNEGLKATDPNNVVPEDVAKQYGFEREYVDNANGLEIWGKDLSNPFMKRSNMNKYTLAKGGDGKRFGFNGKYIDNPKDMLDALGIRNFTSTSKNSKYGIMHVRITVKPNEVGTMKNPYKPLPNKMGDYVANGYGNKNGAFFVNPKNKHVRQFK